MGPRNVLISMSTKLGDRRQHFAPLPSQIVDMGFSPGNQTRAALRVVSTESGLDVQAALKSYFRAHPIPLRPLQNRRHPVGHMVTSDSVTVQSAACV